MASAMSDVASLRDEIALRHASIDDARRELDDGELTAEAFAAVADREGAAIARAEGRLAEIEALHDRPEPADASRRRHRRWLLVSSLVAFAVAVAGVLVLALGPRQPGSQITGGVGGSAGQRVARDLAQAEIDQFIGRDVDALAAYNAALAIDPANDEALTQSGWLYFSAGSSAHDLSAVRSGEQRLSQAAAAYPTDPNPRLYLGIAAASTPGSRAVAVQQFQIFLRLRPDARLRALARPWLKELGLPSS
jgi:tetratricopeptide (TPR) repeat protein